MVLNKSLICVYISVRYSTSNNCFSGETEIQFRIVVMMKTSLKYCYTIRVHLCLKTPHALVMGQRSLTLVYSTECVTQCCCSEFQNFVCKSSAKKGLIRFTARFSQSFLWLFEMDFTSIEDSFVKQALMCGWFLDFFSTDYA